MNSLKKIGLLMFALITLKASAQTDKATTAKIVEQKNFIFVATTAIPMNSTDLNKVMERMSGGMNSGTINLTGPQYDLRVAPDSLIAYLPYYGRAFNAPYNSDENGIKFTAKDFEYTVTKRKKGWDIKIDTKDAKENVRMNLNISENGYATLNVWSNNKQSISYHGYLKEVKKKS